MLANMQTDNHFHSLGNNGPPRPGTARSSTTSNRPQIPHFKIKPSPVLHSYLPYRAASFKRQNFTTNSPERGSSFGKTHIFANPTPIIPRSITSYVPGMTP